MRDPKLNEYGMAPLYEVGDTVKVWPIYKNPTGTIERIVDANAFPIKYVVRYKYHTGDVFIDEFASEDLTLIEKPYNYHCNCQTKSEMHLSWCNTRPKR